jgi:hypothetical protein
MSNLVLSYVWWGEGKVGGENSLGSVYFKLVIKRALYSWLSISKMLWAYLNLFDFSFSEFNLIKTKIIQSVSKWRIQCLPLNISIFLIMPYTNVSFYKLALIVVQSICDIKKYGFPGRNCLKSNPFQNAGNLKRIGLFTLKISFW